MRVNTHVLVQVLGNGDHAGLARLAMLAPIYPADSPPPPCAAHRTTAFPQACMLSTHAGEGILEVEAVEEEVDCGDTARLD